MVAPHRGIDTPLQQLLGSMRKTLLNIKGFSEIKVEKLKDTASKCVVSTSLLRSSYLPRLLTFLKPHSRFMTGAEVLEKRKTCFKIGTGSEQLNKVLGGGFESRSVSEVYGEFRCGTASLFSYAMINMLTSFTGKTQMCMTMAVIAQMAIADGGAAGKVAIVGDNLSCHLAVL